MSVNQYPQPGAILYVDEGDSIDQREFTGRVTAVLQSDLSQVEVTGFGWVKLNEVADFSFDYPDTDDEYAAYPTQDEAIYGDYLELGCP